MQRSVVIALIVVGVVLLLGGACIALFFGF
jgi:flagellar basal body-associated protein FliL